MTSQGNGSIPHPSGELAASYVANLDWAYEAGSAESLKIYEKAKRKQWNSSERIDWSHQIDPENPLDVPDSLIGLCRTRSYRIMSPAQKAEFRFNYHAWRISQFLHGEQGALVCSAKVVNQVPTISGKKLAATQVIDEARHVETFSRLLTDKFGVIYPISPCLHALLKDVMEDSRWDMTYLGMQVLIEGLALASFSILRDMTRNRLVASIIAYVAADEARHVAFGRLALRTVYPQMTQHERNEREEFVAEASFVLKESLEGLEIGRRYGIAESELNEYSGNEFIQEKYILPLFRRVVPALRDIGLWGQGIKSAYEKMGVKDVGLNLDAVHAEDERIAADFDLEKDVSDAAPV